MHSMSKKILLLSNDLKKKSKQSKEIYQEIYGFYDGVIPIPEHRKLYAHIIVDCKRRNGEMLRNYELLLESEDMQKKVSYLNFKRIVIATGLADLHNQIEFIHHCDLAKVEVKLLNRMFKHRFTVFKGRLEVLDEDISYMLECIREKYL